MKTLHKTLTLLLTITASLALVTGCGKSESTTITTDTDNATAAAPATEQLPDTLFLSSKPEGPDTVANLKAKTQPGDTVVMEVVVGGRKNPFVENRAMFTVVDATMTNQCTAPDDACKTKWDYCCESPEKLNANMATIQIVGADGKPLAVNLTDGKIKPMATLVVSGTVSGKPNPETLIVDAHGIFINDEK